MAHTALEAELPGYLAGRLDEDTRARVEAHLEECPECARSVERSRAALAWLRAAVVRAGPHPDPHAVRAHALGEAIDPRVDAHLADCASCVLEAEVWALLRRRSGGRGSGSP